MINPVELKNDELYYADENFFSVSKYKPYLKCEYSAKNYMFKETESMLVGSYVDRFVEGTLDDWIKLHPEIYSSRGKTKGELKSEFKIADEICKYILNDKVFMQFMSGEKQTVMTGYINGVPWKIKMDSYSPNIAINDLKIMAKITNSNGEYIDFITTWGYDIQMAVYQEIVYQNTGEKLPCFICACSKTNPINSVIVNIPQNVLDMKLYEVEQNAPLFWEIQKGNIPPKKCGKCNVCISERKTTPIISLEELI